MAGAALDAAQGLPAVARLLWFNHHFATADVRDGVLSLSDLRTGSEPDYFFRFDVAQQTSTGWQALPLRQATTPRGFAAAWDAT